MIEDAGFYCVQYYNLTGGIVALHSGFKLWDLLLAHGVKMQKDSLCFRLSCLCTKVSAEFSNTNFSAPLCRCLHKMTGQGAYLLMLSPPPPLMELFKFCSVLVMNKLAKADWNVILKATEDILMKTFNETTITITDFKKDSKNFNVECK